jgi:hypothetical protein
VNARAARGTRLALPPVTGPDARSPPPAQHAPVGVIPRFINIFLVHWSVLVSDCRLSLRVALSLFLLAPGVVAAQAVPALPAASAPAQVSIPPAAAPKAPLPNRLNDVLPKWLRVRGELRERMEGFDGLGFTPGRDDSYYLTRLRLTAAVQPSPYLGATVQLQDARVADKSIGPTIAPFRDSFDLRMAFADIGGAKSSVQLRAGRQELVYGDQRLVGHVSWVNAARTFDAAKAIVRGKTFTLDVFAGSVVNLRDTAFNKSAFDASQFYGAYLVAPKIVPKGSIEPYVFYRVADAQRSELGEIADLKQITTGARWVGALPARLDYNLEMAMQMGSLGGDDVRAWAGHWLLRESLTKKYSVKLIGEANHATGDSNATDGTRGTFDQLYPTGHDKYGLADQIGWKNMTNVRAGFELTPRKGLVVGSSYHSIWVADKNDALYNAPGAAIARVTGGAASSHVGQEVDVQATYAATPQISLGAGYAHLFTGKFLKQATPGASYSAPYVMATYVFLADK